MQKQQLMSLTQALTKEDLELDGLIVLKHVNISTRDTDLVLNNQLQQSKWLRKDDKDDTSSISSKEDWDPDKDDDNSDEPSKWYSALVQDYFVGSKQNFAKARELYKIVQQSTASKIAVFYKLKDKTMISDAFNKIERIVFFEWLPEEAKKVVAQTNKSPIEALEERLKEVILNENIKEQDKRIVNYLLKNIESIKAFFLNNEVNTENIYQMLTELNLKKIVLEEEYKKFFGIDMTQEEMRQTGTLYCPEVLHCWSTNLSWVLGHVQKGSKFLVCTDVLQNKYRRTMGSEQEYSAFLREICVALKIGYTLSFDRDKITLRPLNLSQEYLQKLDTTAQSGNGINPSDEEIEKFFNDLEKYIKLGNDFIYRYDHDKKHYYFNGVLVQSGGLLDSFNTLFQSKLGTKKNQRKHFPYQSTDPMGSGPIPSSDTELNATFQSTPGTTRSQSTPCTTRSQRKHFPYQSTDPMGSGPIPSSDTELNATFQSTPCTTRSQRKHFQSKKPTDPMGSGSIPNSDNGVVRKSPK